MKTICPHCKQEFPDTPDEYLETTVTCSVCHNDFVAKKAKYCAQCAAINPGQAVVCVRCGNKLPEQIRPILYHQETTDSSAIDISNLNLKAGIGAIIYSVFIIFLMWVALRDNDNLFLAVPCILYLLDWGILAMGALKNGETGKIVLLTFVPFLGIILCAFLSPPEIKENR